MSGTGRCFLSIMSAECCYSIIGGSYHNCQFCHNKSFVTTNTHLLWQNTSVVISLVGATTTVSFVTTKVLSQQTRICCDKTRLLSYHWWELPQLSVLSQQKFCHNKHAFVVTKHVCCHIIGGSYHNCQFCHNKSFVTTNTHLLWQNTSVVISLVGATTTISFVTTKVLSQQTRICCDKTRLLSYHRWELPQLSVLSQQTRICCDKTRLLSYHWWELPQLSVLSQQTRICCDKKRLLSYHWWELPQLSVLSQQTRICCDKTRLLSYHWWELPQLSVLSQQKFCHNKHAFVVTKHVCCHIIGGSYHNYQFCHNKHTFVVTKNVCCHIIGGSYHNYQFCHNKHAFVVTKHVCCHIIGGSYHNYQFCHNKSFVTTNTHLLWQNTSVVIS